MDLAGPMNGDHNREGPLDPVDLRLLVPTTTRGMVAGTKSLKSWVLDPLGKHIAYERGKVMGTFACLRVYRTDHDR